MKNRVKVNTEVYTTGHINVYAIALKMASIAMLIGGALVLMSSMAWIKNCYSEN